MGEGVVDLIYIYIFIFLQYLRFLNIKMSWKSTGKMVPEHIPSIMQRGASSLGRPFLFNL